MSFLFLETYLTLLINFEKYDKNSYALSQIEFDLVYKHFLLLSVYFLAHDVQKNTPVITCM